MKLTEFIGQLDESRITAAIVAAERRTSGEIRVFVSTKEVDDALAHARRRFAKLGMTATRERNGVLLYFAPRTHKFAIFGDVGIHEKCGQVFWERTISATGEHLRAGRFTEAVVTAIEEVGVALAGHFPGRRDDQDELSNEISSD